MLPSLVRFSVPRICFRRRRRRRRPPFLLSSRKQRMSDQQDVLLDLCSSRLTRE